MMILSWLARMLVVALTVTGTVMLTCILSRSIAARTWSVAVLLRLPMAAWTDLSSAIFWALVLDDARMPFILSSCWSMIVRGAILARTARMLASRVARSFLSPEATTARRSAS